MGGKQSTYECITQPRDQYMGDKKRKGEWSEAAPKEQRINWEELPFEEKLRLLTLSNPAEILHLCSTSTAFYNYCNDPEIKFHWQRKAEELIRSLKIEMPANTYSDPATPWFKIWHDLALEDEYRRRIYETTKLTLPQPEAYVKKYGWGAPIEHTWAAVWHEIIAPIERYLTPIVQKSEECRLLKKDCHIRLDLEMTGPDSHTFFSHWKHFPVFFTEFEFRLNGNPYTTGMVYYHYNSDLDSATLFDPILLAQIYASPFTKSSGK